MASRGARTYRVWDRAPGGRSDAESSVAFEAPAEEPNLTL